MWKTIQINKQNIKVETDRAFLIKCPNNSDYKGFDFWHPAKLIRSGNNSYAILLSYTDDFVFTLKKYGNGKHNFNDVIDTKQIDTIEFEEMFKTMSENLITPKEDTMSYLCVSEPEKLKNINVEIPECLKNNK